ncbi:MAG: chromosome segregation protein SMC [Bacteroidetes bacterium]|nr:chromosome segregation protein SMC [Bacteroidota bacterium]
MYLKKLSIQGFKSFVSPTELNFDSGITAIVGPNGCGKSNIVDALRWVIGEQRARVLRSDKMDSVIFNGTSHRRAVGLADVQLTIANTRGILPLEYSEVTLGRRLYRSGEAEYLLNGVECRLRDITDLFTDTGMGAGAYSVIELKMVDEILSENTQDRRRLFEEASGVTRYKKRRTDALRKLDQMQTDLERVQDLRDEIATRVRSLKRQAKTAERYLRYKAQVRTAHIALLKFEHDRLQEKERILKDEASKITDICTELTTSVHTSDTQIETLRAKFVSEEKRSQINRKAFVEREQQIIKLEGEIRLEEANKQTILQNLDRSKAEKKDVIEELNSLRSQRKSIESTLVTAISEADRLVDELKDATAERDAARQQLTKFEANGTRLASTVQSLGQQKSDYQRQADRFKSRITHLMEEKDRLEEERRSEDQAHKDTVKVSESAQKTLEQARRKLEDGRARQEAAEKAYAALGEKVVGAEEEVQLAEKHLAAKDAEIKILEDLVNTYDFFPDAVRYLLTNAEDLQITTLGDLITCAPKYRAALAASLEPYGGCLVVETERIARMASERLRTEDMGKAYFIVWENISSVSSSGHDLPNALLNLIQLRDEIHRPIVQLLLQDVLVVESLDIARELLEQKEGRIFRYVTFDGEWIDGRGILYAGGNEEGGTYSHLARQDSLRAAKDTRSELQKQVEMKRVVLAEMIDSQNQIGLPGIIQQVREMEQSYIEADRTAQKHSQILELGENQLAVFARRQQQIVREIESLELDAQPHDDQLGQIDQKLVAVQKEYRRVEQEIHSWREQLDQMQTVYVQAHTASVQAVANRERLEADSKRIDEARLRLSDRAEVHEEERIALEEMQQSAIAQIRQLKEQLETERSVRETLRQINADDSAREQELRVGLERANERARKTQKSLQEARERETNIRVEYSAVKARREDLQLRAREGYAVELTQFEATEEIDDVALKEEIQEIERKLQAMGNVNALALEEYEKQSERLEFMSTQFSDLEEAKETLVRTISEINRTASRQFLDTYELIQENFQSLFCELFGEKATCKLELTEPDDVLESPIAVTAKPSGKRPVNITQLSSGEKTLTAIALLFSIYLVKPSPFCFLDEVDAPLDDTNIDHFMRVIYRFSSDTQFVLVTHNKRTMEMANRLYGVTMQEEGVSSLVSIQFDEATAMGK